MCGGDKSSEHKSLQVFNGAFPDSPQEGAFLLPGFLVFQPLKKNTCNASQTDSCHPDHRQPAASSLEE
jgi:hypothetical protein